MNTARMYWSSKNGGEWHMELTGNGFIHVTAATRAIVISNFLHMAEHAGLPGDIDSYEVLLQEVIVKPRIGGTCLAGTRLFVEVCPFCGKQHKHTTRFGSDETMDRMADCGGEYTLDCN